MDFRLKVFHSVACNLSFTKASRELFISQPAISKHIHELEVQYKTPLFERTGSQIRLTRAGRVVVFAYPFLIGFVSSIGFRDESVDK